MSEILLVNPRPRRRRKTRARRKTRVRRNPSRTRARRSPSRRRRSSTRGTVRRIRRKRNPSPRLSVRSIQNTVMNAVPGAVGALGLDVLLGFVPIPVNLKTGMLGYATKGLGAIVLGIVASNFVRAQTATKMAEGALTVMIHGAMRQGMTQFAPAVPLGMYDGMGYVGSGWNPSYDSGMGAYLTGPDDGETYPENATGLNAYIDDDEELMAY